MKLGYKIKSAIRNDFNFVVVFNFNGLNLIYQVGVKHKSIFNNIINKNTIGVWKIKNKCN